MRFLPEFVNLLDDQHLLSGPKVGQKVIMASFNGNSASMWDLEKARYQEVEITAVKRKYIYAGFSSHSVAFDKETFIEGRTDGYSPSMCLFPSMEAVERAREYLTTVERLHALMKKCRTLEGTLPALSALHRAEAELTCPLEQGVPTKREGCSGIFDAIEGALAMAGYTILDWDGDTVYVRDKESDTDYKIRINEIAN